MSVRSRAVCVVLVGWLASSFAVGCSTAESASAKECNDDPSICARGQTCWRVAVRPDFPFQCVTSGPGKKGDRCTTADGSGGYGRASCGDGLICDVAVSGTVGVCVPYCPDRTKTNCGCATGDHCVLVQAEVPDREGRTLKYCACWTSEMVDAGTDAGAEVGTDAGSDAGADVGADGG